MPCAEHKCPRAVPTRLMFAVLLPLLLLLLLLLLCFCFLLNLLGPYHVQFIKSFNATIPNLSNTVCDHF